MRTTVEIKPEHRSALLALAARRGYKGFSAVLEKAIEIYLANEASGETQEHFFVTGRNTANARGRGTTQDYGGSPRELALILADTDVLIDYLAGVQPVTSQIAGYAAAGRLQTTAITCFELLSGAGEGKRGDPSGNSRARWTYCHWTGMPPGWLPVCDAHSIGTASRSVWGTASSRVSRWRIACLYSPAIASTSIECLAWH